MSQLQGSLSRQASIRLQGGALIERGFENEEIMAILEVSLSSVQRWRKKVEQAGLQTLTRKHGTGQACRLSQEQLAELQTIIQSGAVAAGYLTDRWTSRIVADLIFKKWSITYSRSQVRKILSDLGLSYQKPDVKSTEHSQEVVDYWREHEWERIKKVDEEGLTLVIEDESGFSFVPNRNHTWAPVGETPILRESPGRHNHTCIGFITRTPVRHLLQFRFTTFEGAARFEDFVFLLTDIHHYYRATVLILWDNLPSHHAVDAYFT